MKIATSPKVTINKPVAEVFAYATHLPNALAFVPNLIEINNLNPEAPGVGQKFNWTLNMSGVVSHGEGEVTIYEPNQAFQLKFTGDADALWDLRVSDVSGNCHIDAQIDYDIKDHILAQIAKTGVLDKLGQKYTQMMLNNLKILLED